MISKSLLNQIFLTRVVILSAALLFACASVLAQQTEPLDEEQEVDLDSLDEDVDEQTEDQSTNKEMFLPMNAASVEVERNPALVLFALAVLIPLSTLLIPLERMRKGRRPQSRQNRKTNS